MKVNPPVLCTLDFSWLLEITFQQRLTNCNIRIPSKFHGKLFLIKMVTGQINFVFLYKLAAIFISQKVELVSSKDFFSLFYLLCQKGFTDKLTYLPIIGFPTRK